MDDDLSADPADFQLDIDADFSSYLRDYPTVNVYFAVPLTGIDESSVASLAQARMEVRSVLESYSGYRFDIYDPAEHTPPGTNHKPVEVYSIDHERVVWADVVFFFALDRSIGLGMEAQIAASATIPRVVLHRLGQPLTRMFLGAPSRTLATVAFSTMSDLNAALHSHIAFIAKESFNSRTLRDSACQNGFKNFGRFLLGVRIRRRVSLKDLAHRTDQTPEWLAEIERTKGPAPLSMELFLRICDVLQIDVVHSSGSVSATTAGMEPLSPTSESSLCNLISFVTSKRFLDDARILQLWNNYFTERKDIESSALVGREDLSKVITENEWKTRYEQRGLFD